MATYILLRINTEYYEYLFLLSIDTERNSHVYRVLSIFVGVILNGKPKICGKVKKVGHKTFLEVQISNCFIL